MHAAHPTPPAPRLRETAGRLMAAETRAFLRWTCFARSSGPWSARSDRVPPTGVPAATRGPPKPGTRDVRPLPARWTAGPDPSLARASGQRRLRGLACPVPRSRSAGRGFLGLWARPAVAAGPAGPLRDPRSSDRRSDPRQVRGSVDAVPPPLPGHPQKGGRTGHEGNGVVAFRPACTGLPETAPEALRRPVLPAPAAFRRQLLPVDPCPSSGHVGEGSKRFLRLLAFAYRGQASQTRARAPTRIDMGAMRFLLMEIRPAHIRHTYCPQHHPQCTARANRSRMR